MSPCPRVMQVELHRLEVFQLWIGEKAPLDFFAGKHTQDGLGGDALVDLNGERVHPISDGILRDPPHLGNRPPSFCL